MIAGRERSAISNFSLDTCRLSNKDSVNKWSAGVLMGSVFQPEGAFDARFS
jgi:hypothetical protein